MTESEIVIGIARKNDIMERKVGVLCAAPFTVFELDENGEENAILFFGIKL